MRTYSSILTVEHPLEQRAFSILCGALAVCVVAYLYFVGASVLNIMARKEAIAQVEQVRTAIAQMEQEYFALNRTLTARMAVDMGLAPVGDTAYVYRPGAAAAARTLNDTGI